MGSPSDSPRPTPQTMPSVRASQCQATLGVLRARSPDVLGAVLGRLPEPVRQGLTSTTRLDLVPASWDAALAKALAQELGDAATREVARASMLRSLRGPLLGGLGSGVLRLFGMQPGRFFRWADKAWGHVTKGCGDLVVEAVDDSSAILALRGMPPSLAIPEYLTYVAGTLESIFDVCKVSGAVAVLGNPDGARFTASWSLGTSTGPRW